MKIVAKDFLQQMEDNKYLNQNQPDKFLSDRYEPAENFKLFGIQFGKKKSSDNPNGMTDEEAADLMNRRRKETKQIQIDAGISDEQGNIIGIRQKPGKIKTAYKPKKPKISLPDIFSTIGDILGGNKDQEEEQTQWTADSIAKAKSLGDVQILSNKPQPLYSKGEKTFFYIAIAVILVILLVIMLKKNKK